MGRYRKKAVVIEAVQFAGNFDEIERFVGGDAEFRDGKLVVATLEGPLRASPGDWIIRGVKGDLYSCKPGEFAAIYEDAPQDSEDSPDERKCHACGCEYCDGRCEGEM